MPKFVFNQVFLNFYLIDNHRPGHCAEPVTGMESSRVSDRLQRLANRAIAHRLVNRPLPRKHIFTVAGDSLKFLKDLANLMCEEDVPPIVES